MKKTTETITLKYLAQMFVDFDKISAGEWDKKYGYGKVGTALSKYFKLGSEYGVVDIIRVAMDHVLTTGKSFTINKEN